MARRPQKKRQQLSRVESVQLTQWVIENKAKLEAERRPLSYWADRATVELKFDKPIGDQSFHTVCSTLKVKWHDHVGISPSNRGRFGRGNRVQQLIVVTQLIARVADRMAAVVGYDLMRDDGLAFSQADQVLWQHVLSPDYNRPLSEPPPLPDNPA